MEAWKKYLNPNFDYKSLTKTQLRNVMSQFNIESIPPLSAKKDKILKAYKESIVDRIPLLKKQNNWNFSDQNIFQSSSIREDDAIDENSEIGKESFSTANTVNYNTTLTNNSSNSVRNSIADDSFITNSVHYNSFISSDKSMSNHKLNGNFSSHHGSNNSLNAAAHNTNKEYSNNLAEEIKKSDLSDNRSFENLNTETINFHSVKPVNIFKNRSFNSTITQSDVNPSTGKTDFIESNANLENQIPQSHNDSPVFISKKSIFISKFKQIYSSKTLRIFFTVLLILAVYSKFFIPYCDGSLEWCVPLPRNGYLENGVLKCHKNFKKVFSYIDHCAFDYNVLRNKKREADKCIRKIECIKGEFIKGYRSTPRVATFKLTKDPEVLNFIFKSGRVIVSEEGSIIEAIDYIVPVGIWIRKLLILLFKLSITGFLFISVIIFIIRKIRFRNSCKAEAHKITKSVMETLRKQLNMALRSPNVSDSVYSKQLQAAYGINNEIWHYVEHNLKVSVNIESKIQENGDVLFKWGGPIYYDNFD